jgi:hypothetical protein
VKRMRHLVAHIGYRGIVLNSRHAIAMPIPLPPPSPNNTASSPRWTN